MAENAGDNRREFPRIDARVRVKLKFDSVKNLRQFYTKDISQGGLFIVAEKPKPIGTRVEIVIYPPGVPLGFPLQGTVVHVIDAATAKSRGTAPGMGIRFGDLTEDKVASIKAYIDSMGAIEEEETVVASKPPPKDERAATTTVGAAKAVESAAPPAALPKDTRPVELRLASREQLKKLNAQDLSKGTLFIRTPEVRPVGSVVSVHLIVDGMVNGLWISANVVRVIMAVEKGKDTSGMGLELTDLSDEKRKAISDYLKGRADDLSSGDAEPAPESVDSASDNEFSDLPATELNVAESAPPEIEPEPTEVPAAKVSAARAVPATSAKGAPAIPPVADFDEDMKDKRPALLTVDQVENAVKDFENAAASKNYFDQLGLPTNALLDEIKTAYFQLVRRFHPDPWQGKVKAELLDRLQKTQMHLRTMYDTLSHPQKRAAYEVSNGIDVDGGDPILQQAREKKRAEYRAAFARKFGDHISKGERLIDAAMEDIRAGKSKSALSNIRLALSFDPLNEKYRKLLKTVLEKGGKA